MKSQPNRSITALVACVGLLIGGCSANKVDWGSRVGSYNFDQAVMELGPPDKQATLSDGMRVADWMTRRGGVRRTAVGPYRYYGPYNGSAYPVYVDHQIPDYFLRLVFDEEGTLLEWKKLAR